MARDQSRIVEFGMHPKPGMKYRGKGIALEGDDLKRHRTFTKVPMRAKQVPIAVDTIPDELGVWNLADLLCSVSRHGVLMEPIRVWPIELC